MNNLLTILSILAKHPELVSIATDRIIVGSVNNLHFTIKILSDDIKVILTLEDNNKVDFIINNNKETFDILFKEVLENSKKYRYNQLLKELKNYENSCSSFNNN